LPRPKPRQQLQTGIAVKESLAFLWPIFTIAVFLAVVMMMNTAQLSFLLVENGITNPSKLANVMLAGSLMTMVGSLLYSELGPKIGVRGNYTVPALLLGMGCMVIGLSHGPVVAAIGGSLTGTGAGWMIPHFSRLILGRSPVAARGRAVGLFFSAIYFGDLINPLIIRPISLQLGLHQTFLIIGAIVAVTALQIVLPRRKKAQLTA